MTITSQKTKLRHNTVQGACQILSSGSHASWRSIKRCRRCNQIKSVLEFDKNYPSKDGHINICKTCKSVYNKKYSQTEQNKAAHKRYNQSEKGKERYKRYSIRHPDKIKAKNVVRYAIRVGKLSHPNTLQCSYGYHPAEQYHHHKGYTPEHWLDVVPTCEKCHKKIHSPTLLRAVYKL